MWLKGTVVGGSRVSRGNRATSRARSHRACRLRAACCALQGKSEEDVEKASRLFSEIQQQLDSKQLKPFVRTQYMRSAFQVR